MTLRALTLGGTLTRVTDTQPLEVHMSFKVEFRNPPGSTDNEALEQWREPATEAWPAELREEWPWTEKVAEQAAMVMRSRGYEARVVPE